MGSSVSTKPIESESSSVSSYSASEDSDSDDYVSLHSDMDEGDMTSDAAYVPLHRSNKIFFKPLGINELDGINNYLAPYEKISLAYLLCVNPDRAYTMVEKVMSDASVNILKNWALHECANNEKWYLTVLEALTIIKNYQILRILGYNKSEIDEIFLPTQIHVSLHVNVIRKGLYHIFDNLENVLELIAQLKLDLERQKFDSNFDTTNLELIFLSMERIGYISLSNITNLVQVFKYINLDYYYEELKSLNEKVNSSYPNSNSNYNIDEMAGPSRKYDYQHVTKIKQFAEDTSDKYDISPDKPGLHLIINNKNFYTDLSEEYRELVPVEVRQKKLEIRDGTEKDEEALCSTFKHIKFEVIVEFNKRHTQIIEAIENCIQKVQEEKYSTLFISILSHGREGKIFSCNSVPIDISEIQNRMQKRELAGIPKVLIVQACRGRQVQEVDEEYETDGPVNNPTPKTLDTFVFYSTIPGFAAVRHKERGSWLIQSLCKKINNSHKDHFQDICTQVIKDVSYKRWGKRVMVPTTTSTLTKKLYLVPEVI